MMRLQMQILILFLILLFPIEAYSQEEIKVITIGDSITGSGINPPLGQYGYLLSNILSSDYVIINAGCSGATTEDCVIESDVDSCPIINNLFFPTLYNEYVKPEMPADFVTIMIGTNDAFNNVPKHIYKMRVETLIGKLLRDGAKYIILMPPPLVQKTPLCSPTVQIRLGEYREVYYEICELSLRVHCGPDIPAIMDIDEHLLPNTCNPHPNQVFQNMVASELVTQIYKIQNSPILANFIKRIIGFGNN